MRALKTTLRREFVYPVGGFFARPLARLLRWLGWE
jgi:hypothetical protein